MGNVVYGSTPGYRVSREYDVRVTTRFRSLANVTHVDIFSFSDPVGFVCPQWDFFFCLFLQLSLVSGRFFVRSLFLFSPFAGEQRGTCLAC